MIYAVPSYQEKSLATKVDQLLNDPPMLTDYSLQDWDHLPREEIDRLQLAGLKQRFGELRDKIGVLKKLADAENIDHIDTLEDVVPLLFEHTVFKSYPPSLLENNRFKDINKWLGKLTAHPIDHVDVSTCQTLDEYFDVMDAAVPALSVAYTSGTSGTISLLPQTRSESAKSIILKRMTLGVVSSPTEPLPELHVAYPFFRSGRMSHLRGNDATVKHMLKGEEYFHAAYPMRMSADVQYLAARIRAATAKGTLDRLKINPAVLAKKAAFDKLTAEMPQHMEEFFAQLVDDLKGKRIYVWATWNLLHNMAKAGLGRGFEKVFAENSVVGTGGGAKGLVQPEGWQDDILRFTGAKQLNELYAMSEVISSHWKCEHDHFHFSHTAIPFLLDPQTSKPLPRAGRVTGRAAFFDLGADARWGGFITGDELTVEWDKPCACGRSTAYIVGKIQRYSEKKGGDDKITCAATEENHAAAMDFLNSFEM
ncbi:MAG: hypothetical protein ABW049_10055 [Spongiibacteraceae bacterium]